MKMKRRPSERKRAGSKRSKGLIDKYDDDDRLMMGLSKREGKE